MLTKELLSMTDQQIDAESIRAHQQHEWTVAAPAWQKYRQEVSSSTSLITELLIRLARIREGDHVLDLACGVGDPAFPIAELVGPQGFVLGLDITKAMLEGAEAYAQQQGIHNVEFRQISNELELAVPNASFDAITCRHGLMYMPDPLSVLRVLQDALKPGGHIAVSTWGPLEHCPFAAIPLQIITRHISFFPLNPKAPNPFALSTRGKLKKILTDAGFKDVQTEVFDIIVYKANTPEALWDLTCQVSVSVAALLASLPQETQRAIREDALETFATYLQEGSVTLSGETLIAVGSKPL